MLHNEQTENLALLFAYGELEGGQEKDFIAHLKECPRCQAIVRACAVATASLPEVKAPDFKPAPQPLKQSVSLWDHISPLFNFRKLAPAGAMALLLVFASITVYKYGRINENTDLFMDNMYAEITNIESYLDTIFEDFENL